MWLFSFFYYWRRLLPFLLELELVLLLYGAAIYFTFISLSVAWKVLFMIIDSDVLIILYILQVFSFEDGLMHAAWREIGVRLIVPLKHRKREINIDWLE